MDHSIHPPVYRVLKLLKINPLISLLEPLAPLRYELWAL